MVSDFQKSRVGIIENERGGWIYGAAAGFKRSRAGFGPRTVGTLGLKSISRLNKFKTTQYYYQLGYSQFSIHDFKLIKKHFAVS